MTIREWPAQYEVRVLDGPDDFWQERLEWLRVDHDGDMVVLSGVLPDQSALRGVLGAIQDLGLTIVTVRRLDAAGDP